MRAARLASASLVGLLLARWAGAVSVLTPEAKSARDVTADTGEPNEAKEGRLMNSSHRQATMASTRRGSGGRSGREFRDYLCVSLADCMSEPIGHGLPRSNHDALLLGAEVLRGWVSDSERFLKAIHP
jgi:hypothetical protein